MDCTHIDMIPSHNHSADPGFAYGFLSAMIVSGLPFFIFPFVAVALGIYLFITDGPYDLFPRWFPREFIPPVTIFLLGVSALLIIAIVI